MNGCKRDCCGVLEWNGRVEVVTFLKKGLICCDGCLEGCMSKWVGGGIVKVW